MGVSGSGKSTVGAALAQRLAVPFADADDFHPPANIAKMTDGVPLDDEDRRPWLESIGEWLAEQDAQGGVISCSALKIAYRDQLRAHAPRVAFVHLHGTREVIARR
ncbi:gluconokinase, partial [Nocardioides albidus]